MNTPLQQRPAPLTGLAKTLRTGELAPEIVQAVRKAVFGFGGGDGGLALAALGHQPRRVGGEGCRGGTSGEDEAEEAQGAKERHGPPAYTHITVRGKILGPRPALPRSLRGDAAPPIGSALAVAVRDGRCLQDAPQ